MLKDLINCGAEVETGQEKNREKKNGLIFIYFVRSKK